jgi:hypothetical protein
MKMSIEDARRKHEDQLMQMLNVTGVGIGEKEGKQVIKVYVTHKVPESDLKPQEIVPKKLDGWETDVEEIGVVTEQTK